MKIAAKTEIGKVRFENQDDYRASAQGEDCAWVVVCDGMGGANGGSVASELAVTCVQEICTEVQLSAMNGKDVQELAAQLVEKSNERVYRVALQEPELSGMGTTMVVALMCGSRCTLAWVGDSRAYLWNGKNLQMLTKDHSMVQELVDKGFITPEEAENHPQKNVITRAVGIHPQVETDVIQFTLDPSDILLLCTDGLTNAVAESKIEGILQQGSFYEMPGLLIDAVLEREEQDNSTVALLSMK